MLSAVGGVGPTLKRSDELFDEGEAGRGLKLLEVEGVLDVAAVVSEPFPTD